MGSHVARPSPFLKGEDQSHDDPKSITLKGAPDESLSTTRIFSGLKSLPDATDQDTC